MFERFELLLQDRYGLHRGEDTGDPAVDLEGCQLVAGCLSDHDFLHELLHDVDEGLFRFRAGMFAHVIEGGVDSQLDSLRADLSLQLPDPPPKILHLRRVVQPGLEAGTAFLDPVSMASSAARPGRPSAARSLICWMIWRCSCVEKDLDDVRNAIILPWSNGQTEGQFHTLEAH